MNSIQSAQRISRALGKRLVATVLATILLANLMSWSFPLLRNSPMVFEFTMTIYSCVVFGWFLNAGVLALASWNWRKRLLVGLFIQTTSSAAFVLSYWLFSSSIGIKPIFIQFLYWHLFAVSGLAGPFVMMRIFRNVRIDINREATNVKALRRIQELYLLATYWILAAITVFAVSSVQSGKLTFVASMAVGMGLFISAFFVLSLFVGGFFLCWFNTRHFVLVSVMVVPSVALVFAPAIGFLFYYLNTPGQANLSFFWYSREFTVAMWSLTTFAILAATLVVGLRWMGYQLIWPKSIRQLPEKREPDPWD